MSKSVWEPLNDNEIKRLVAEICEPDHEDECAALQVLMRDIFQSAENPERVAEISWQVNAAARATFDDVMDDRTDDLREKIFGKPHNREIVRRVRSRKGKPRGG
ncbi:MAG TPA: hypothetical protein VGJ37_18495 [Pyrinomonadaceae bacterium]|jgi:hypothetical protein